MVMEKTVRIHPLKEREREDHHWGGNRVFPNVGQVSFNQVGNINYLLGALYLDFKGHCVH